MRRTFYAFYYAVQRVLAPGLRNSQYAYKEALERRVAPGVRWLDLGCGHQLFPDWMAVPREDQETLVEKSELVVGIDADLRSLHSNWLFHNLVAGNIQALPFADGSFDLVTANMVLEHVEDPSALLAEVHRVLRPGGIFMFHTPNLWGYTTVIARLLADPAKIWLVQLLQGRKQEDIFPTFYRLNTPARTEQLAQRHGFSILEMNVTESSAQTVMLGPVVIPELLLIRALRLNVLKRFRTNVIAALRKPILASPPTTASAEMARPA